MEPVTVRRSVARIRPCTVSEIETLPGVDALIAEYAAESAVACMGEPDVQWEAYRAWEAAGALHPLCAEADGEIVGFVGVLLSMPPHHRMLIAGVESYFVTESARKTGAGLALLRAAESLARSKGAQALFIGCRSGSRLARIGDRLGYDADTVLLSRRLA